MSEYYLRTIPYDSCFKTKKFDFTIGSFGFKKLSSNMYICQATKKSDLTIISKIQYIVEQHGILYTVEIDKDTSYTTCLKIEPL
jgi:hypothetical protein